MVYGRVFAVGGCVALAAQFLCGAYRSLGCGNADAISFTIMTLGVMGALFSENALYRTIEQVGGMGAVVPISGLSALVADRALKAVCFRGGYSCPYNHVIVVTHDVLGVLKRFIPGFLLSLGLAVIFALTV